jgi:hypothetical protein
MQCKLCQLEKPLIEAHIVPKCLLKPLFSPTGPIRSISKDISTYPKRFPIGVYDSNILCAECDNSFSPWEQYTAELLFETAPKYRELAHMGFYSIPEYDYAMLKLCVLSVLWRMSITRQQEYERVSLGQKYENDIRTMLLAKEPGAPDMFSVAWLQLTDYVGSGTALGTSPARYKNATIYNLGLPGFVAVIKVGQQQHPHPLQPAIMTPDSPLIIGLKEHRLEDDWKPAFRKIWTSQQHKRR